MSPTQRRPTLVGAIGDAATFYKVGMELAYGGGGLAFLGRLAAAGKQAFSI